MVPVGLLYTLDPFSHTKELYTVLVTEAITTLLDILSSELTSTASMHRCIELNGKSASTPMLKFVLRKIVQSLQECAVSG